MEDGLLALATSRYGGRSSFFHPKCLEEALTGPRRETGTSEDYSIWVTGLEGSVSPSKFICHGCLQTLQLAREWPGIGFILGELAPHHRDAIYQFLEEFPDMFEERMGRIVTDEDYLPFDPVEQVSWIENEENPLYLLRDEFNIADSEKQARYLAAWYEYEVMKEKHRKRAEILRRRKLGIDMLGDIEWFPLVRNSGKFYHPPCWEKAQRLQIAMSSETF